MKEVLANKNFLLLVIALMVCAHCIAKFIVQYEQSEAMDREIEKLRNLK